MYIKHICMMLCSFPRYLDLVVSHLGLIIAWRTTEKSWTCGRVIDVGEEDACVASQAIPGTLNVPEHINGCGMRHYVWLERVLA